jgi:hypothetical protein
MPINSWRPSGPSDQLLGQTLVRLLDIADDRTRKATDYHLPNRMSHILPEATRCSGKFSKRVEKPATLRVALSHGYGPADDFRRRLAAAWEASQPVGESLRLRQR